MSTHLTSRLKCIVDNTVISEYGDIMLRAAIKYAERPWKDRRFQYFGVTWNGIGSGSDEV